MKKYGYEMKSILDLCEINETCWYCFEGLHFLYKKREKSKYFHCMNYDDVIYTGTSAGGYPALKFSCYFRSICIISNCQLYLESYGKNKGYGLEYLKELLKENNDSIIYKDKQIEQIIEKHLPKKIVLYCNILDSTFQEHVLPFFKYMSKINKSSIIDLKLFTCDSQNIEHEKTHHHFQFPNSESHMNILQKFIR